MGESFVYERRGEVEEGEASLHPRSTTKVKIRKIVYETDSTLYSLYGSFFEFRMPFKCVLYCAVSGVNCVPGGNAFRTYKWDWPNRWYRTNDNSEPRNNFKIKLANTSTGRAGALKINRAFPAPHLARRFLAVGDHVRTNAKRKTRCTAAANNQNDSFRNWAAKFEKRQFADHALTGVSAKLTYSPVSLTLKLDVWT